jgi:hypothetical protein
MRLIRAIKPFFQGAHSHQPDDPPFELEESRARDLVKAGIAEFVVDLGFVPIQMTTAPAPAAAEQAVGRRQKRA